jgi:hypothetical protein
MTPRDRNIIALAFVVMLGCGGETVAPTEPCESGYSLCGTDMMWNIRCNDGRLARMTSWGKLRPFSMSEVTVEGPACPR